VATAKPVVGENSISNYENLTFEELINDQVYEFHLSSLPCRSRGDRLVGATVGDSLREYDSHAVRTRSHATQFGRRSGFGGHCIPRHPPVRRRPKKEAIDLFRRRAGERLKLSRNRSVVWQELAQAGPEVAKDPPTRPARLPDHYGVDCDAKLTRRRLVRESQDIGVTLQANPSTRCAGSHRGGMRFAPLG
jgi:hypothetical protein